MSIYIPDEIEKIIDGITLTGDVTNVNEIFGITELTITNYTELLVGMIITLDNINYQILSINNNVISISAIDITATNWSLAVNFLYGHRQEINEILTNKDNNQETKFKNFPLIWLDLDIEENKNTSTLIESEADIILVFVYKTKKEYRATTRLNDNFKLIIQPLLDLFIEKLNSDKFAPVFVKNYGEILSYKKIDRYFYGSADKNKSVFKTLTDAIEIKINLKFKKIYKKCN